MNFTMGQKQNIFKLIFEIEKKHIGPKLSKISGIKTFWGRFSNFLELANILGDI